MLTLTAGSRRYVWLPLVECDQLAGYPMVKPAVSPLAAWWVNVVQPLGSAVDGALTALTICGAVLAGGSVVVPADDDEPFVGLPGVWWWFSRTMVVAPAAAPSTASTTSAIFHHRPDRRRCGVPGWNSGHEP